MSPYNALALIPGPASTPFAHAPTFAPCPHALAPTTAAMPVMPPATPAATPVPVSAPVPIPMPAAMPTLASAPPVKTEKMTRLGIEPRTSWTYTRCSTN